MKTFLSSAKKDLLPRWLFLLLAFYSEYVFIRQLVWWDDQGMRTDLLVEGVFTTIYFLFGLWLKSFLRRMPLLVTAIVVLSALPSLSLIFEGVVNVELVHLAKGALGLSVFLYLLVRTRKLSAEFRGGLGKPEHCEKALNGC